MPFTFDSLPILIAQNAGGAGGSATSLIYYLPYAAIFVLWFYLLVIRPQKQSERERKSLLDAVKKNDRVITTGGMYGTVVSVDPDADKVVIRIDDDKGVRATFIKGAIVRIVEGSDKEKDKVKAAENA